MDQWPHEKRIEALGDVMRYFRPSIRNHERSAGLGVLAAEWDVVNGDGGLTLDTRVFPLRLLLATPARRTPPRRDLFRDLLREAMVGWIGPVGAGPGILLAELRVDPVVHYMEFPTAPGLDPYLCFQYILRVPCPPEGRPGRSRFPPAGPPPGPARTERPTPPDGRRGSRRRGA